MKLNEFHSCAVLVMRALHSSNDLGFSPSWNLLRANNAYGLGGGDGGLFSLLKRPARQRSTKKKNTRGEKHKLRLLE
jgi:hypothetical protein